MKYPKSEEIRKWMVFLGLILSTFVLQQIGANVSAYQKIKAMGFESDALFYTESPEARRRSFDLQQSLKQKRKLKERKDTPAEK